MRAVSLFIHTTLISVLRFLFTCESAKQIATDLKQNTVNKVESIQQHTFSIGWNNQFLRETFWKARKVLVQTAEDGDTRNYQVIISGGTIPPYPTPSWPDLTYSNTLQYLIIRRMMIFQVNGSVKHNWPSFGQIHLPSGNSFRGGEKNLKD